MIKKLLTPIKLGANTLKNRLVMAPLTRMRADSELATSNLHVVYYSQRASAGLIVTEGSQISRQGQGYPNTPGIYSPTQIDRWKKVTEAVHAEGGLIFIQIWHVGRISHSSHQLNNALPVSASAIAAKGEALTATWQTVPFETPRALEIEEIKALIEDYRQATINAKAAGFDGVELHSANGYLMQQFLQAPSNQRTDEYGGSIENRARILFEVLDAIISAWDADHVGIRLSPFGTANDSFDPNPYPQYSYIFNKLNTYKLAYLHVIRYRPTSTPNAEIIEQEKKLWASYLGNMIAADGYTEETAEQAIEEGLAEAIAFGRNFISNPDLPKRFELNAPLNPYDRTTFYGGGEKGYIDYPFLKL
jgi:N-ethylmaleimide reductase